MIDAKPMRGDLILQARDAVARVLLVKISEAQSDLTRDALRSRLLAIRAGMADHSVEVSACLELQAALAHGEFALQRTGGVS